MPFHRPIPESKRPGERKPADDAPLAPRQSSAAVKGLVQAEKMMQIAFILPCCLLVGWGIGWWIDSRLHTHWVVIAGVILGIIAGMVSVIRLALAAGNAPDARDGR